MRWMIRSLLALVLLVLLAGAALILMPTGRIAAVATERFEALTGRSLTITGAVRPSLWPSLGVQIGPVEVSNAAWSDEGPMLRAEGLEIALDMAALWGGDIRITAIRANRPQIILERARDGRANWVFGGPNGGTATAGMPGEGTPFTLDLAEISEGSLTFIDHGAARRVVLSSITGTARIPAWTGPAEVRFTAEMNGQAAEAELRIGAFGPFLDGQVTGLDATLTAGDATLTFAGRGGWNPMGAEGDLTADLANMADAARLLGIARPAPPQGLGAGRIAVAGRVTLTDAGSLHLRGGRVTLDDNTLSVEADLRPGADRPRLSAQIAAQALNLAGLSRGQGGGAAGGASAAGWPTDRIDVSALGLIDAEVALSAASVDLGVMRLGTTRATMTLDRARAVFDLRQIAAYEGSIAGQFVVNGRGGLSVGGDLRFDSIAMQPLLRDLGGYERLIGTGDLSLKFLGVGTTVDQIMRSLSGSGRLALGKGELRGLDIAGMLRNLDPNFVGEGQRTIFDSLSASFGMDGGVLSNDDLALKAPYVTATGSGTVNLGARSLDYRLRPTALAAADGSGGIMVPLLISGPWADPRFRLDLESLARERLEEEARALEDRARAEAAAAEARAKAELERRAEEELGVTRQEGESLEDAAKRRAEEVLEEEAGRLLQQLLRPGP